MGNAEQVVGLCSCCALARARWYLQLSLGTHFTLRCSTFITSKEKTGDKLCFSCGEWSIFLLVTSQAWITTAHCVKEPCKSHWSQLVLKQCVILERHTKKTTACMPYGGTGGATTPAPLVATQAHHKQPPTGSGQPSINIWCWLKSYLALKDHSLPHYNSRSHRDCTKHSKNRTKTTLGSRDSSKTAFVSMWDSSPRVSLKGEVWGGNRGEEQAPSANTGRGKRPNTQNPLQAGGKAKLPPEEGECRPLGKGERAAGDPRMRCNL